MIRFIDLRGQIGLDDNEPCFTFYNTVIDHFLDIHSINNWDSLEEFTSDFLQATEIAGCEWESEEQRVAILARFTGLIPRDYFKDRGPTRETLNSIDREDMLRAYVQANARKTGQSPLWALVMDACLTGSTSGYRICCELGWNPDAKESEPLPPR